MSDHATIGKTAVEYTENGRHIACLKKQLSDLGGHMVSLGNHLQSDPASVVFSPNERLQVGEASRMIGEQIWQDVPPAVFDRDQLRQLLELLANAEGSRKQLEETLRGMGLQELIR